jgi:hypothetical protein
MIELVLVLAFVAPSWLAAAFYYRYGICPHLRSQELKILNINLAKTGQFWSNSDSNFKMLSEGAYEHDIQHMYRSFLIMTALLSLLSVVGMFLLILIFISGRPRLERNVFASDLVRSENLNVAQVQGLIAEARAAC